MLEKERLEKDALNRIRWDDSLSPGDFTVTYLDRVTNRLFEVPYASIEHSGDYFTLDDSQIPVHRIREIKHKGEVVWAKRKV